MKSDGSRLESLSSHSLAVWSWVSDSLSEWSSGRGLEATFRVGIWTVTLALPVSQIEVIMWVSVEKLEEAGEQVSFLLQIRRYTRLGGTPSPCLIPTQRPSDARHTEVFSRRHVLQTSLFPFVLRDLSFGALEELTLEWCAVYGVSSS